MSDIITFCKQVKAMRDAQRKYFSSRTTLNLERAKSAEAAVDAAVAEALKGEAPDPPPAPTPVQGTLL